MAWPPIVVKNAEFQVGTLGRGLVCESKINRPVVSTATTVPWSVTPGPLRTNVVPAIMTAARLAVMARLPIAVVDGFDDCKGVVSAFTTSRLAVSNARFVPAITAVSRSPSVIVVPGRAMAFGTAVITKLAIVVVIGIASEEANVSLLVLTARAEES